MTTQRITKRTVDALKSNGSELPALHSPFWMFAFAPAENIAYGRGDVAHAPFPD